MEVKDNETIGLKSIIVGYLLHWKLFAGVFLFSLLPAVLYLILYPRTYEIMARIQIQEDKDLGGGYAAPRIPPSKPYSFAQYGSEWVHVYRNKASDRLI